MTERIWLADLTEPQLSEWLRPTRSQMPFAILERLDAIEFPASDDVIELKDWAQGRVFGPTRELRWERRGAAFWVRVTGTDDPGLPFVVWSKLGDIETRQTYCYLWGKDEMRIGRRLEYRAMPDGSGRPCLLQRELWRAGRLVASRLVGMEMEVPK
jgi:hypothetical protein